MALSATPLAGAPAAPPLPPTPVCAPRDAVRAPRLPPSSPRLLAPSLPGSDTVPLHQLTHCSGLYTNPAPVPHSQQETFLLLSLRRPVAVPSRGCLGFSPGGGDEGAKGKSKRKSVPRRKQLEFCISIQAATWARLCWAGRLSLSLTCDTPQKRWARRQSEP